MEKQGINCGLVKVYFGNGITLLEAGDTLLNGKKAEIPTAEVEYIEGIMSFQDAKIATFWGEELCNEMGAYIIPQVYNGEIIGLEKAIKEYIRQD